MFVQYGVDGCVDDFANLGTGATAFPIALLVFVFGFFEAHVDVHVDDGHDFAGFVGLVVVGAVECPTIVKADFAEVVGFLDVGEVGV